MSQFAQYLSTFKIFTKSCKSVHKFVFNALLPPCRRVQSFLMKLILVEVVVMYIECGIIFHYFEITSGGRHQKEGGTRRGKGNRYLLVRLNTQIVQVLNLIMWCGFVIHWLIHTFIRDFYVFSSFHQKRLWTTF